MGAGGAGGPMILPRMANVIIRIPRMINIFVMLGNGRRYLLE
jgi:hypothetical protein